MAENHLPQGDDVAQQENNGFGPLFKRRGKTATFTSVIAVLIISAMLFFTVKGKAPFPGVYNSPANLECRSRRNDTKIDPGV